MLRLLLIPVSWLYGLATWLRNYLYDHKVLLSHRVPVATIGVGNLSVGGTGKTPHVEYLVELLRAEGFRVAVLSRGYKRRTKGFLLANEQSTVSQIGDEMMQMSLRFPDVPMAVCENRVRGVKRLMKAYPDLDVVVLDDAFQHRALMCGYYLLLTSADSLYVHDHLLPYGRLREAKIGALRANAVVVTKCPKGMKPIDQRIVSNALNLPTFQSLYFSETEYLPCIRLDGSALGDSESTDTHVSDELLMKSEVILLTGIAHSHYLRDYAEQHYTVVDALRFDDHHAFTEKDVALIERTMSQHPSALLLTTEKDAMRLRECKALPASVRAKAYYQPIKVAMKNEVEFNQSIIRYVKEANRHR